MDLQCISFATFIGFYQRTGRINGCFLATGNHLATIWFHSGGGRGRQNAISDIRNIYSWC